MTGRTNTERFASIEASLNKMMEMVQEASTIDSAANLVTLIDTDITAFLEQLTALEQVLEQLTVKVEVIKDQQKIP